MRPMIVLAGPTASGKTIAGNPAGGAVRRRDRLAATRSRSIARWRSGPRSRLHEERAMVPHHLIDMAWPDEQVTAGDYSRLAREALRGISERGRLPIVAGGTGFYLRALIDGLFPAPAGAAGAA